MAKRANLAKSAKRPKYTKSTICAKWPKRVN